MSSILNLPRISLRVGKIDPLTVGKVDISGGSNHGKIFEIYKNNLQK